MSTDVLAIGTYYHQTPVGGSAATAWVSGGPRKGTTGIYKEIGYVLFDKGQLAATINGANLPAAKLVLSRDTAYGTGTVDICIAPAWTTAPPQGEMTYDECMSSMTIRHDHYLTTVTGETCSIGLPGYFLLLLRLNIISGFIIYQEDGEGTGDIARFTAYGKLELTLGSTYAAPVWKRPVGAGDVICDASHSHTSDLWEIMHYVNHRESAESTPITPLTNFDNIDVGSFADWAKAVRRLQGAIDAIYTAESKTAITWLTATDGDMPNAAIINQLRNALETTISGGGTAENIAIPSTNYARTYFDNMYTDFTVNRETPTTWSNKPPMSGMNWEYVMDNGEKKKKYNRRLGFWLLAGLTDWSNVNTAKIRLTRENGNNGSYPVTLRPVTIASVPTAKTKVNAVFGDMSMVCGSANAAIGETIDIELNAATKAGLAGGTITGVGVDDHDNWTNFAASATLIIT